MSINAKIAMYTASICFLVLSGAFGWRTDAGFEAMALAAFLSGFATCGTFMDDE